MLSVSSAFVSDGEIHATNSVLELPVSNCDGKFSLREMIRLSQVFTYLQDCLEEFVSALNLDSLHAPHVFDRHLTR